MARSLHSPAKGCLKTKFNLKALQDIIIYEGSMPAMYSRLSLGEGEELGSSPGVDILPERFLLTDSPTSGKLPFLMCQLSLNPGLPLAMLSTVKFHQN